MHIVFFVIALGIISIGVYERQFVKSSTQSESDMLGNVSPTSSPHPPLEDWQPAKVPAVVTLTPTSKPPTPTVNPKTRKFFDILLFHYPDSQITQQSVSTLTLVSSDQSDVITDWYKEKISSLQMNTKSFVTTRANDQVKNELVGTDGNQEIRVKITKTSTDQTVFIDITTY